METKKCLEDCWVGTVTVGERGQIVIPAEARKKLGIASGDTLFASSHPNGEGLMLFKIEAMREFLNHMSAGLSMVDAEAGSFNGSKRKAPSKKVSKGEDQ